MKRPGHKNFNAISHNRSRPEVLFLNITWRSRGQISSVLLQLLLLAFSNRKFGRHRKWSVTFWQWENNTQDRMWLWDTALKFFGRAFSLRYETTWCTVHVIIGPQCVHWAEWYQFLPMTSSPPLSLPPWTHPKLSISSSPVTFCWLKNEKQTCFVWSCFVVCIMLSFFSIRER